MVAEARAIHGHLRHRYRVILVQTLLSQLMCSPRYWPCTWRADWKYTGVKATFKCGEDDAADADCAIRVMPRSSSYRGASQSPALASEVLQNGSLRPKALVPAGPVPTIPRPKKDAATIYVNPANRLSLQVQMHLNRGELKELLGAMRLVLKRHIDSERPIQEQKRRAFDAYIAECSKLPKLRRYTGCWPAVSYCNIYLRGVQYRRKRQPLDKEASLTPPTIRQQDEDAAERPIQPVPPAPKPPTARPAPLPAPTSPTTHRAPADNGRRTASSSSHLLSLRSFLGLHDLSETRLLQIFHLAGVYKLAELEKLARDDAMQNDFLERLTTGIKIPQPVTVYECSLIKAVMRQIFVRGFSMDRE